MDDNQFLKEGFVERGSVQLSFEKTSQVNEKIHSTIASENGRKRLSKNDLCDLYKQEIDELINAERKKISSEYDLKFKKEISIKEKELSDALKSKHQIADEQIKKFKDAIEKINDDFNSLCNKEIIQFDTLIVKIVVEVLYKITGTNNLYQELVGATVKDALVKKISDFKSLTIKVSKEDYLFFKKNFNEESWVTCIKVDERLSVGKIVLDDGLSLFECGLVDQLDVLQAEFVAAIRSNYE